MLPGLTRALKRAVLAAATLAAVLTTTACDDDRDWVIWHEGPSTSGRGPGQEHYVVCVPADDPVDGPLREVLVDEDDAHPVPDPVTGQTRYSQGQPCPDGPART